MGQSFFASLLQRDKKLTVDPAQAGDGPVYEWPSAAKPAAVLVPPLVRAHRVRVRVRKIVLGVVAGTAAVSVLGAAGTVWMASSAKADREDAESKLAAAQATIAEYAPHAYYSAQLQARQQALNLELGSDIDYAGVARAIIDARAAGVTFTGLDVTPGQPCPAPDPFDSEAALGCVKVMGKAPTNASVGRFVDQLNHLSDEDALTGAFASSLSNSAGAAALDFTVTVNYTDAALSYRYVPQADDATDTATDTATDAATADGTGDSAGETTDPSAEGAVE